MATKKLDYEGLKTLVTAMKHWVTTNFLSLRGGG